MDDAKTKVGANRRAYRMKLGLSQEGLADQPPPGPRPSDAQKFSKTRLDARFCAL